jgi:hypothetical protein
VTYNLLNAYGTVRVGDAPILRRTSVQDSIESVLKCTPLYDHTIQFVQRECCWGISRALLLPWMLIYIPLPAISVLESKRGKWEIHYSHFQPKGIICTRYFSYLWRKQDVVHCPECFCFTFCRCFSSVCLLAFWKFSCEDYRSCDSYHKTNEFLVDWGNWTVRAGLNSLRLWNILLWYVVGEICVRFLFWKTWNRYTLIRE